MSENRPQSSALSVYSGEEWRTLIAKAFLPMTAESLPRNDFAGRIDAIDAGDFSVARVTSMPQTISRSALACRHTPADMIKVLIQRKGAHHIDQSGRRAVAPAGSLTAYNTDVPYTLALPQKFCADVIMVPRTRLTVAQNAVSELQKRPLTLDCGTAAILSSHVDQLLTRVGEISAESAIRMVNLTVEMLAVVLGNVAPADQPPETLLFTVQRWIKQHLGDECLHPTTIGAANGISVRHLHRLFAREGLTVSAYVRRERLRCVRAELRDPLRKHQTIRAIGARWGLADQAHLSRLFREEFGQAPSEWRMNCNA